MLWYRQRLRAMTPAEIPWRAWRFARQHAARYRHWDRAEELPMAAVSDGPCHAARFRAAIPTFPHVPSGAEMSNWPRAWREGALSNAEEVLAHRVSLFGLEPHSLGEEIDWNHDYSSGKCVPTSHSFDLDFRNQDQVGDVKHVWELGRMQHLLPLAQAFRLTGESQFAQEIVSQITSWIRQCPYMRGIHWTSPMEAALRLISWTWAFQLIRDWDQLADSFCQLLTCAVHQHLQFVDANYSAFSSANNHLVAEASGAYFAACYWSGLKSARRCKRRAGARLIRECQQQNWPDGVNKEQTFGYQFFVWDLFLLAGLMGRAHRDNFPTAYWTRLRRMADFLLWVSDANGHTPNVGDEDGGVAVLLDGNRNLPATNLQSVTAQLWGGLQGCGKETVRVSEKCAWLIGPADDCLMATSHSTTGMSNDASKLVTKVFPEGGYVVWRCGSSADNEVLMLFDAGPLGWPATAAHGHADALSIWLHLRGRPVLIDAGTYSYQDGPRRRYFRGTSQHNTLGFQAEDQGEYLNRFMWGKRPEVKLLNSENHGDVAVCEGEVTWWNGTVHRRRIEWSLNSSSLQIEDSWQATSPPVIGFTLHPSIQATMSRDNTLVTTDNPPIEIQNATSPVKVQEVTVSLQCCQLTKTNRICVYPGVAGGRTVTCLRWHDHQLK